jgi:Ser/Thr protein kinase RdoA (MazF antagonist)
VSSEHPYDRLTPEVILSAVEQYDLECTGEMLALNSYENRVYRIGTEQGSPIAVKFYRPERWTDAAIAEEHQFALELAQQEIPVVAPMHSPAGETLSVHDGFRYTVFPWQPGRTPELNIEQDRLLLGRFLGRLHSVGASAHFQHRPVLSLETYGKQAVQYLLEHDFIPDYLQNAYQAITDQILGQLENKLAPMATFKQQRLHGDFHLGNLLWTETGPHFVDLDDCMTGPAIQDLWLLLSGDQAEMEQQLQPLLEGYNQFADFNPAQLALIEPLRTLRLLHYSGWLARRWHDPAFPRNFPWFNTIRYWEEQILNLREQLALLDAPPLQWQPDSHWNK